jgi:hypothetical protein
MNVVKSPWQYRLEACYLLTDIAFNEVQAPARRPYRASDQVRRTAKTLCRRLDYEDAKEAAARRSSSGRGLRVVALRRPYHVEFVR